MNISDVSVAVFVDINVHPEIYAAVGYIYASKVRIRQILSPALLTCTQRVIEQCLVRELRRVIHRLAACDYLA